MAGRPTPFALAIEAFINEKRSQEDKDSLFYKEILSRLNTSSFSRDAPDDSKIWAESLATVVNDLERDSRTQRKGRRFVERVGRACAGFNQYASACDVLIQAGPAAAVLIYGGARLLLQLSQKVYDCYETIVDILEDISTHIQCFHAFSQAYAASEHVQKQLVKSYKLIINFWLKASKLLTGHTLTKLFSKNTQLSREWKKYCGDLHRCKDQVCYAVEAAKADLIREKAMKDQVQAREKQRQDTLNSVEDWIRGDEDDGKLRFRHTILEKVSIRHGTSCDWLLHHPDFQVWRNATNTTSLWLCSQPGSGKSVLASHVAKTLEDQKMKVVSYFFSFNDLAQKKTITMLRSLALQLMAMYQTVPDSVMRVFAAEAKSRCSKLENLEIMTQLLQALLKQINRVHIIVDGLDECEDRSRLLYYLPRVLSTKTLGIVKWFFTSRPEKEFQDCLPPRGVIKLNATKDQIHEDVQKFMDDSIRTRLGIDCSGDINYWVRESDGNFLWAHLTLRILEGDGLTCEAEIDEALAKFPRGLEGCYERTLCLLVREKKEAEWRLAQKVFRLMVAAVQPLRLSEISHGIAALSNTGTNASSDGDFNSKRIPRPAVIEVLCSGLVEFDRTVQNGQTDPLLKFAHKSVRDFLIEDPKVLGVSDEVTDFFVTDADASLLMGSACLAYLSFATYQNPQDLKLIVQAEAHAFLRYAAAFWQHHLSSAAQTKELYESVLVFATGPCLWNTLAVQSLTVPHIFAPYYQIVPGGYSYHLEGLRRDEVIEVAYGSPLPLWLDETTFGHEGREIVEKVHSWIQHWNPVLSSHPAAFGQCVMDSSWEASFPSRKAWVSDRIAAYWLLPSAEDSHNLDDQPLYITSVRKDGSPSRLEVKLRSSTKEVQYIIDLDQGASAPVKTQMMAPMSTEDDLKLSDVLFGARENLTTLHLNTLMLRTAPTEVGRESITYQPTHTPQEPWHIRSTSEISEDGSGESPLATFAIYCSSDVPKVERRMQDQDSGFFEDSDSNSDSDTASISSDMGGSNLGDAAEDDPKTDKEDPNRCMLIGRPEGPPIWSFWTQKAGLDNFRCAIGHAVAIWSSSESEACIADVKTGQIKRAYLPEPSVSDGCSPPIIQHREFHFSDDESIVYFLRYMSADNDFGVEQKLSISALKFSMDGGEPLLTRSGDSCSIEYASAGNVQWPLLLTHWTSEYVYIALPSLSCDPKLLRLSLSGLSANGNPSLETLYNSIYFPSNTADRKPKIHVFGHEDNKSQLVLLMNSHQSGKSSEAPQQAPIVMIWTLDNETDWRQWDEKLDRYSEQYKFAEESCDRLRGDFVDPGQRFLVPIRSGLDWTKKAFIACI